ncbi:MAG TPA: hypothetical protein VGE21_13715 [Flavobacteriales bacterium]
MSVFRLFSLVLVLVHLEALSQDCRVRLDSSDTFSGERYIIVDGPPLGLFPRYSFLAEHQLLFLRITWAVPGEPHAVALMGDPLLLKLTNGRVLDLRVDQTATSTITGMDKGEQHALITFDVPLQRSDIEALSAHWVARLRMHFTTGGIQDLDTGTMSVWPMDLTHTAKCFLEQLGR